MDADNLVETSEHMLDDNLIEYVPPISDTVLIKPMKRQRKKKGNRLIIENITMLPNDEMLARKHQLYIECVPPKIRGLHVDAIPNLTSFQNFDKKSVHSAIMNQNKLSNSIRELFASKPLLPIPKQSPIQSLFPKRLITTTIADADESILVEIKNADTNGLEEINEHFHDDDKIIVKETNCEKTSNLRLLSARKRSADIIQPEIENVDNPENLETLQTVMDDEPMADTQNDVSKQPLLNR